MSSRAFIENVINLAVESCLVRDIPAILTPKRVDQMDSETLKELASESEDVHAERTQLQRQVNILREGLRRCQQHKRREHAGMSLRRYKNGG